MYKLYLGLGYSVFKYLLEPIITLNAIQRTFVDKVYKHKIVLNDDILEYYKSNSNDEMAEMIDYFVTANAGYELIEYCPTNHCSTITEEFISLLIEKDFKIFFTENKEFDKKDLKKLRVFCLEDLKNENNPLNLYTLPITNYMVCKGDNRDKYLKWFGHFMQNEKYIRIIDPYILTQKNIEIFNSIYLSYINKDSIIEIYGTDANAGSWTIDALNERIDRSNHVIDVYLYRNGTEHDRFIWAGDIQISIGKGLDFIDLNRNEIQKKTTISITERPFVTPQIDRKL